jgi:hypothetical protein
MHILDDAPALAEWCAHALEGVAFGPDEAAVFVAAALVLLPPELELRACLLRGSPAPPPLREALRALWLRSGMPPPAPSPMPEQPLAPGLPGIWWRRLCAALALAPRGEPQ